MSATYGGPLEVSKEELAFRASYLIVKMWPTIEKRAKALVDTADLPQEVAEPLIAKMTEDHKSHLGGLETYEAARSYLRELPPGPYEVHRYGGFLLPKDPERPAILFAFRFCDPEGIAAWLQMIKEWYGPRGLNTTVDAKNLIVMV